jgi:iron uptake system EfeUOB component EfeO/EfeM
MDEQSRHPTPEYTTEDDPIPEVFPEQDPKVDREWEEAKNDRWAGHHPRVEGIECMRR